MHFIKKTMIYLSNACNKRDSDVWVFGEWFGKKCCDNACFFANYIAEEHPELRLYWICEKDTDTTLLDSRIQIIDRDSPDAVSILRRAKVAVVIQGINDFYEDGRNYLGNALKVNLWHGIMWKKLGYDCLPEMNSYERIKTYIKHNINRHYLFISPNDEYRRILKSAFMLKDSEIINAGYPRNIPLYSSSMVKGYRAKVAERLKEQGVPIKESSRIVVYMPTFRDNTTEVFSFFDVSNEKRLYSILDQKDIIICEKMHAAAQNILRENNTNSRIVRVDDFSAVELLTSADILITDYSSCFFDYLLLDRPIIHYIYDYEYYMNEDRGVYYSKEEVACGKTPENYDQLLEALSDYLEDPSIDKQLRENRKEFFWKHDDGNCCETIFEEIIERIR